MVSNAAVPGLTHLPASLSPEVITELLREQPGFSGLVLTDPLSAAALSATGYPVPWAGVDALAAGADMLLFKADPSTVATLTNQTVQAIVSAVGSGELSRRRLGNAVLHVLHAKHINMCGYCCTRSR